MRKISGALAVAAAVALLGAPAQLRAQDPMDPTLQGPSRISIEPFLAHYFADVGDDREGIGGFGVRAMIGRGDVSNVVSTFISRGRVGVFVAYTAEQNNFTTLHFGGQLEAPLFAAPVGNGFLDPFVSVGLGGFRTSIDLPDIPGVPEGSDADDTNFALTPGVGTLIPLFGAIAIRGDIRDVIVFGEETTNNFVFEGGISIGF